MHKPWHDEIIQLLNSTSIASLATQAEEFPECSMVPYALLDGKILIHISTLARHTRNIAQNQKVGLMICTCENPEVSPLSLPRLSFHGLATAVTPESFAAAKACYLEAIPDAAPLFDFGDFSLYEIDVTEIYWVGGFGAATNIDLSTWRSLSGQSN